MNIQSLKIEAQDYPPNLKHIPNPPQILYYRGEISTLCGDAIAIVGTRKSTFYGEEIAQRLAFELAECGITIISGLAAGIDTAAHRGALKARGKTAAVLAGGLENIFPSENENLALSILESGGALLSEYPAGTPCFAYNFPRRNRIISGLSLGVVIVEAGYKSGAMITAKLALDQGREVFAVPGSIQAELSRGPHWLIKQGAKLVESVEDILEEFCLLKSPSVREEKDYAALSESELKIIKRLSYQPSYIDEVAAGLSLEISRLSVLLTALEMKNFVQQLPGKYYVLK